MNGRTAALTRRFALLDLHQFREQHPDLPMDGQHKPRTHRTPLQNVRRWWTAMSAKERGTARQFMQSALEGAK